MSTTTEPPNTARDARAQAKAEKAYRKAQRPWYKKKRFILAGLLVAFIVIVSAAGGGSKSNTTATDPGQAASGTKASKSSASSSSSKSTPKAVSKPAAAKQAGFGDKVRDGKFEFRVSGMDCGKKLIGSQDFGAKAQGQFCLVSLSVENIGDEAQMLSDGDQYLFDTKGRRYSADTAAAIYLRSNTFLEQINPGNTVKGQLVFDVPKSFSAKSLELHDSPFSGGVTIAAK
jgi:hypothetical protein